MNDVHDEKREARRQRTLKSGLVVFNKGQSSFDCTIRNMSQEGAQLRFTALVNLPDRFTLLISREKLRFECQVAWQKTNEVGVRFV